MADLSRPTFNKIGEDIELSFRYASMQRLLQVRSIHTVVSGYNDLKVELTYKIKIKPVDWFI